MSLMFLESTKYFSNKNKKNEEENEASKKYKNNFNLPDAVDLTYQKMIKDKKDDPDKKIPPKFGQFVKSPEYKDFLESMLDYCRELFRLENK